MSAKGTDPRVSIVIPARDAATTLPETLDSVIAQTSSHWEAIVIDDDSRDTTRAIAVAYTSRDDRIRVLSSDAHSEGGSRNVGIVAARAPWLLFLDADDLIEPYALENALDALARDPDADGVVFGWIRFDAERISDQQHWDDQSDPFELVASHTPFPIHACLIRRSVVTDVGMFDPSLFGVADWDLWQRVFRSGARLVRIGSVGARYRVHAAAMSRDAASMLAQSRRVLVRTHAPDARVATAFAAYADGAPTDELSLALLRHACWWGGIAIATGQDAAALLDGTAEEFAPGRLTSADAELAAVALEQAMRQPTLRRPEEWPDLWRATAPAIATFLARLEAVTGAADLAWLAERILEPGSPDRTRATRGNLLAVDVELTRPIEEIAVEDHTERVVVIGRLHGRGLGFADVPVVGGSVAATDILDACVERWYWDVVRDDLEGRSCVHRGATGPEIFAALLSELWPQPDLRIGPLRFVGSRPTEVAAGEEFPRLQGLRDVEVLVRVGSTPLPPLRVARAVARRRTRARREIAGACAVELSRAVAKELLLGRLHRRTPDAARVASTEADGQATSTGADRSPSRGAGGAAGSP